MMKRKLRTFLRQYQVGLQTHLHQEPGSGVQPAHRLGQQAVTPGLETRDLATCDAIGAGIVESSVGLKIV